MPANNLQNFIKTCQAPALAAIPCMEANKINGLRGSRNEIDFLPKRYELVAANYLQRLKWTLQSAY